MKKRSIAIVIGIPLALLGGFFVFLHFIFVEFEHREDHNGVGWSKFTSSIRKHVEQGPYQLSDLSMYEGGVWFNITDTNNSVFGVSTSRGNYADARDVNSLKSQYLSIKSVNGRELECVNNFGEGVRVSISSQQSPFTEVGLTSLNSIIESHSAPLSGYGDNLPKSYDVSDGVVLNKPEWLDFDTTRSGGCCCEDSGKSEIPISVSCELK